jgi:DNA polymerase III alpha subunit (gram-positive type)
MNKRTIIVLDCETTSLSPENGELVQIACTSINPSNLDNHYTGSLNLILKPKNPEKIEQGALNVIGNDLWNKAINEGLDQKVALQELVNYCNKCAIDNTSFGKPIIAGHNIKFDINWITYHLLKYNIIKKSEDVPFYYNSIDTMMIAFLLFESDPMVRDFKLDTFLSKAGLSRKSNTHDAMEDVQLTAELLKRSLKFFREASRRMKIKI